MSRSHEHRIRDVDVRTIGRFTVATALCGLVASLVGGVAGVLLLRQLNASLGRSLDLTVEALTAVDDSLTVAADTLALAEDALGDTQRTADEVAEALTTGASLLDSTAALSEERLAPNLMAIERAMPNLVTVASAVDTALSALARLPFGITYDPERSLGESLREIDSNLSGTGAELEEQAALIREASAELETVGRGAGTIARDLEEFDAGMAAAAALVTDYSGTATGARELIVETRDGLRTRSAVATGLVILIALVIAAGQVPLLWVGRQLVRHADRIGEALDAPAGAEHVPR